MSDDPATDKAQPPPAEPPFPEAPPVDSDAAPEADATSPGGEVEYVYQDEHGNPIAAPEGGFNADEFEVVEVEAPAGAAPDGGAPAADPELVAATTQKVARPVSSGRRTSDRKSGRQPKPMTPEELKKVRTRVILVLGLLSMIPILGIALIFMLWKKGHIKIGSKKPTTKWVDNEFTQGEKIFVAASPHYRKANQLYEENKRAEAYAEYKLCEKEYNTALETIRRWSDGRDLTEYKDQDACIRQIQIELRHVRERLVQLEASGDTGAPKPPPAP